MAWHSWACERHAQTVERWGMLLSTGILLYILCSLHARGGGLAGGVSAGWWVWISRSVHSTDQTPRSQSHNTQTPLQDTRHVTDTTPLSAGHRDQREDPITCGGHVQVWVLHRGVVPLVWPHVGGRACACWRVVRCGLWGTYRMALNHERHESKAIIRKFAERKNPVWAPNPLYQVETFSRHNLGIPLHKTATRPARHA